MKYRNPRFGVANFLPTRNYLWIAAFGFLLLHFSASISALAQSKEPNINVTVSPNPVPDGESVALHIGVEFESSAQIGAPSFSAPDFDIVGQSNSIDIVTVMINGRFTPKRKNNYTFILAPKKQGSLAIQNIELEIGGKKYHAENLSVKVEKASGRSSGTYTNRANQKQNDDDDNNDSDVLSPNDPSEYQARDSSGKVTFQLNSDFTVRAHVNKNRAVVGEPIVVEYYLYDFGNLTRVDIKKWPTFNGFWKEDLEIPTRFDFRDEYANGRRVRKALLGRFALYPLKPGKIPLDKLIVNGAFISNMQRSRGNDPFANFFGLRTVRQASHSSQDEYIQVEPLPDAGKPGDFSGAVGNFDISLVANKSTSKVNEPINFKFTVKGTGNFQAIEAPNFKFPEGLELYESNANVQANAPRGVSVDLNKSVSFDLLVVPRKEGRFNVPAFSWSYFDIHSKTYKTLNTHPIEISVSGIAKDETGTANPTATATKTAGETVVEVKEDSRYLKTTNDLLNTRTLSLEQLVHWAILGLAALNALLLLLFLRRNRARIQSSLQRKENKYSKLKIAVAEMEHALKRKYADYGALEKAITLALETLTHKDLQGTTSDELQALFVEKGLDKQMLDGFVSLRNACHAQRYSPESAKDLEEFRKNVSLFKNLLVAAKLS